MLHRWHHERPDRWHVPPLEPTGPPSQRVTLLELMPGAFLKSVGLPYKGYKKGRAALERRDQILSGLAEASEVRLPNLDRVRMACRANDDCLDAVVAAVGAAAWARDPSRFHHPNRDELADAALEGWIYVPRLDGLTVQADCRPRSRITKPMARPAPTSCITMKIGAEPGRYRRRCPKTSWLSSPPGWRNWWRK